MEDAIPRVQVTLTDAGKTPDGVHVAQVQITDWPDHKQPRTRAYLLLPAKDGSYSIHAPVADTAGNFVFRFTPVIDQEADNAE